MRRDLMIMTSHKAQNILHPSFNIAWRHALFEEMAVSLFVGVGVCVCVCDPESLNIC